jgi:hypothetical protein
MARFVKGNKKYIGGKRPCPYLHEEYTQMQGVDIIMRIFEGVPMIGLKDNDTKKVIAVYPQKAEGTDDQIEKSVKDWYYATSCSAEDILTNAFVDKISKDELNEYEKSQLI